MQNAFDGLISGLDTAEKMSMDLKISHNTFPNGKTKKHNFLKKNRIAKNYETITKAIAYA